MKVLSRLTFLLMATTFGWNGQTAPFKNGDRVVFLGDSITHHGQYMEQIALYYATRFPEADIWFSNSGQSGDVVSGAMRRLERDVFAKKPTVVAVMFGMNDVRRGDWPRRGGSKRQCARRRKAIGDFKANMVKLVSAIRERANNPTIVYLTPSPFDQTCLIGGKPSNLVCNNGLADLGAWIAARAKDEGALCVDLQTFLRSLNEREQAKDPHWSFMRSGKDAFDRVHPSVFGHQFFAYAFLKAQGVPADVSRIAIDAARGVATDLCNAEVKDLVTTKTSVSFTARETALPYPFDGERRKACEYAPIVEDLNRETFRVTGLAAGAYVLKIDGRTVGEWTAQELAAGVNLAMNEQTPQNEQARMVMKAMAEQWERQATIRNVFVWRLWEKGRLPLDDMKAYRAWCAKQYPKKVGLNENYFGHMAQQYRDFWECRADVERAVDAARAEVRARAKCVPHTWALTAR